ncbi:hypothetical protein GE09DRAFT_1152209 [Coniochaeta sp. 2T2.1]|nr:hypothetical protein GE09DRAFT_1152209 [Coniochaeta sp. 2T2.1]
MIMSSPVLSLSLVLSRHSRLSYALFRLLKRGSPSVDALMIDAHPGLGQVNHEPDLLRACSQATTEISASCISRSISLYWSCLHSAIDIEQQVHGGPVRLCQSVRQCINDL